jgi:lyso-ornithine lipid O-acyltransferase
VSARAVLRLIAAALLLVVCLPLWAVSRIYGGQQAWVRRFLAAIGRVLGLRVTVEGAPRTRPTLYVANHITWLDILALGGHVEAGFVAKAEIADWPLVGWLARIAGTIFVSRDRPSLSRDQADAVATALKSGRSVVLFAEGGTGDGHTLLPFRAALFASAVDAGVPVQPVAVDYGPERVRFAWPSGASFGRAAKGLLERTGPAPVTLKFLQPLPPSDRKRLAAQSQAAIGLALDQS